MVNQHHNEFVQLYFALFRLGTSDAARSSAITNWQASIRMHEASTDRDM